MEKTDDGFVQQNLPKQIIKQINKEINRRLAVPDRKLGKFELKQSVRRKSEKESQGEMKIRWK